MIKEKSSFCGINYEESNNDWEEEILDDPNEFEDDGWESYEADADEAYEKSLKADEERFLNNIYR